MYIKLFEEYNTGCQEIGKSEFESSIKTNCNKIDDALVNLITSIFHGSKFDLIASTNDTLIELEINGRVRLDKTVSFWGVDYICGMSIKESGLEIKFISGEDGFYVSINNKYNTYYLCHEFEDLITLIKKFA